MRYLILFVAMFAFVGCSSNMEQTDKYRFAANSWAGGNIEEMVNAWGTPNAGFLPAKDGEDGVAGWSVRSTQVAVAADGYYCSTLVYFDASGTITSIDVRRSRSCQQYYRNQFECMTRITDE